MALIPKVSCCECHRSNCECNPIKKVLPPILGPMGDYLRKLSEINKPRDTETNKDPFSNFRIKRYYELNDHLLLHVYYTGSNVYESDKYLVFKDIDFNEVYKWDRIDPHFCNNPEHPSPIARFEPTYDGWNNAIEFIKIQK